MGGGLNKQKIIASTIAKVDTFCNEKGLDQEYDLAPEMIVRIYGNQERSVDANDRASTITVQERRHLKRIGKALSKKEKCFYEKIDNHDRRGPGGAGCGCGMRINLEDFNGQGITVG